MDIDEYRDVGILMNRGIETAYQTKTMREMCDATLLCGNFLIALWFETSQVEISSQNAQSNSFTRDT